MDYDSIEVATLIVWDHRAKTGHVCGVFFQHVDAKRFMVEHIDELGLEGLEVHQGETPSTFIVEDEIGIMRTYIIGNSTFFTDACDLSWHPQKLLPPTK